MKPRESSWSFILVAISAWIVGVIALGFMLHANWKLFMIGWRLWS